ncbi:hypothetical protein KSP40_PGU008391 [Platanthera guangdongensis]|uniref:Uncharacterized protein n=1 Tax=Platanthera guangdongensis TaxID=2320717 RepID=A0ABR2LU33_9ASPA
MITNRGSSQTSIIDLGSFVQPIAQVASNITHKPSPMHIFPVPEISSNMKSPYYYEETNPRDQKRRRLFRWREEGDEVILSTKLPSSSSQYGPVAFDIGTTISSRVDAEEMERMKPADVALLSCRDSKIASSHAHFVARSFLTSQQENVKIEGKYETTVQSLEEANKKFNYMSEEWSVKEAIYLSREEDLLQQIATFQIQRDKARQETLVERERVKEVGVGGMKLILELLHERGFIDKRLYLEDVCPELFPSTSGPGMGQPSLEDKVSSESGSDNDK